MNRIVGLETEYGCLSPAPGNWPAAVGRVRNWIFEGNRHGVADLHQRDWDEPAGNGGFLFNGGRCYVDMGHLEYCTPECLSLRDVLRYDRAGDMLISAAVTGLGLERDVSFIRNNIDYYEGATFGCHENYLVRRNAPLTEENIQSLLAFLTLRLLFTGAGRVRSTSSPKSRAELPRSSHESDFQISQRADFINNDLFEWVQFNRAIINTRDEPLADARRFRRLHLLHGDTSVLPATLGLKVGTTALMLDLLELDRLPRIALADAVLTFRALSHQPDGPWLVPLAAGGEALALELLQQFQAAAESEFHGRDPETDTLLAIWKQTLEDLHTAPERLVGVVDWVTKRWLFNQFIQRENLRWDDAWLHSQDLEFHQVDARRNLGWPLAATPEPWTFSDAELAAATTQPPVDTRAAARTKLMHLLQRSETRFFVDWSTIDAEGVHPLNLLDPFDPAPPEAERWLRSLNQETESRRHHQAGVAPSRVQRGA